MGIIRDSKPKSGGSAAFTQESDVEVTSASVEGEEVKEGPAVSQRGIIRDSKPK